MADHVSDACDSEIQPFHSPSSSPHSYEGALDTLPFEDTVPLDASLMEDSQMENLDFDTQLVDGLDCGDDDEVVLDSEDEEIAGTKVKSIKDRSSNGGKESAPLQTCNQEIGRLKYVESEEPGESSQANALDFVDRFLLSSSVGCSPITEVRHAVRKKPSPVTSTNGPQSLAKCIRTVNSRGNSRTFEWIDTDEYEGVSFCSKRMDASFDVGGCQTRENKAKEIDSQRDSSSGTKGGEKSVKLCKDIRPLYHSYSRNAMQCQNEVFRKEPVSEMNSESNSFTKPNGQLTEIPTMQVLEDSVEATAPDTFEDSVETNAPDNFDVGFNTQMAAEVMEALSCCASTYGSAADAYQGPQNSHVDSSKGVLKSKTQVKGPCLENDPFSSLEGLTGVSNKRKSSAKKGTSCASRKNSSHQQFVPGTAMTAEMKRTQRTKPLNGSLHSNESSARKSAKLSDQIKEVKATNIGSIKEHEYDSSLSPEVQGKPLACETRQCITASEPKTATEGSGILGKRMNNATKSHLLTYMRKRSPLQKKAGGAKESNIITYKRKVSPLQKKAGGAKESNIITYKRKMNPLGGKPSEESIAGGKCRKLCLHTSKEAGNDKLCQQKQDNSVLSSLTDFLRLDSWSWPKGKRMHRKQPRKSTEPSDQLGPSTAVGKKGHHRKLFNKNLPRSSLLKELIRLGIPGSNPDFTFTDLRKRRDMAYVRVLFSQHLGDDIITQQKKILARLGISVASCLIDATHFIADRFVRTGNMLEAIALGKPVVTHLWIESCGQANFLIDEKNYILRDAKKEKEIGFSLPVSLSRSSQHPLLKGKTVLITPNVKPNKEMVARLVKAVHGQEVEKSQIPAENSAEDYLILSCEEDHAICLPFLEKGLPVYSSELLLNGIIIQKLEYARHRLFVDHAKISRSTKR